MNLSALQAVANSVRSLTIDAVEKAKSGHPGLPMGCAELGALVYGELLSHWPQDPQWANRDRFVLSAGHGCMLLYSLLHLSGYDLSLDDIKGFRQLGSRTPGHPEWGVTPGSGGHGRTPGPGNLQRESGMAIAERDPCREVQHAGACRHRPLHLRPCKRRRHDGRGGLRGVLPRRAPRPGQAHRVLRFQQDHDRRLDRPRILRERAEAVRGVRLADPLGRHVRHAGHREPWWSRRRRCADRPTIILLKSIIGKGAPTRAGTAKAHGEALGPEEAAGAKKAIGVPDGGQFYVFPEATRVLQGQAAVVEGALRRVEEDAGRVEGGESRARAGVGRLLPGVGRTSPPWPCLPSSRERASPPGRPAARC